MRIGVWNVGAQRGRSAQTGRRLRQHHHRRGQYRVRTFSVGAASALGAPLAETQRRIAELHKRVVFICGGVIIGTVVVRLVLLDIHDRPVPTVGPTSPGRQRLVKPEEVQCAGSARPSRSVRRSRGCRPRIGNEQARTRAALETARDFAAVASHELRTPLTAMRTNLEVLSTLDLGDEQRKVHR